MSPLYLSLILLALATILMTFELMVPSAGTLGLLALCAIIGSIAAGFYYNTIFGAILMLGIVIAVPFLFQLAVKIWPHTPLGKMILIGDRTRDDVMPNDDHYRQLDSKIGQIGTAKTKMYPSGIVIIDGHPFDAVSNGFPIEAGDSIQVAAVKGNHLQVKKIDNTASDSPTTPQSPTHPPDSLATPIDELGLNDLDLSDFNIKD